MAGLTPFQFSSRATQDKTTSFFSSGFFGVNLGTLGSILGETAKDMLACYEMWINPDKVSLRDVYLQKPQHTAGGIATYHYRKDLVTMSVSGYAGWILNPSADVVGQQQAKTKDYLYQGEFGKAIGSFGESITSRFGAKSGDIPANAYKKYGAARTTNPTDNSARKFLQRLKAIAEEPMYFVDREGVEHYNTKMIKIYTKQYPNGLICEGYYTSFDIPETAQDPQTIGYSFEFKIERATPMSFTQRVTSSFVGKSTGVGELLRAF